MTKPRSADEGGIGRSWNVRICVGSTVVHVASHNEPKVLERGGKVVGADMDLINGTEHGDTIGFIDWSAVTAVTWRRA